MTSSAIQRTATMTELEEMPVNSIVEQQMALEPYMSIAPEIKNVTFDSAAARQAGASQAVIELTEESVAYQNRMMAKMAADGINDVTQVEVSMDDFPLLKAFQARATAEMGAARDDANAAERKAAQ